MTAGDEWRCPQWEPVVGDVLTMGAQRWEVVQVEDLGDRRIIHVLHNGKPRRMSPHGFASSTHLATCVQRGDDDGLPTLQMEHSP